MLICSFTGCSEKEAENITKEGCKEILDVTEHGIVAKSLESAEENTKAINKLIRSSKENTAIYFPKDKYYFVSDNACIQISNKKSLVLCGDGAVIINASFDPCEEVTPLTYHKGMTVGLNNCENIRIEGLHFDYLRYTQVCGRIVEKNGIETAIELDQEFLNSENKPAITGDEIASAVNVLDENGASIEERYADGKFLCRLQENRFYVFADFGQVGKEAVVRFNFSTAPEFYAQGTSRLTIDSVKSYSSPAAAFLMSGEGNSDLTFNNVTVAPPENAVWRWGSNVDGIFINCMRGRLKVTNCTFKGMGDDSLNVHSTAATVKSVDGSKVTLNYAYNDSLISRTWAEEGDILIFYKKDFKISAKARVKKRGIKTLTLDILEGAVSVGDIAENQSLSPEVTVENVTVDGGRARAFLIQSDNVKIKNCNISNLGLAGIIISPDINKWYEMGPSENVTITGCSFTNVCAMGGSNCKGAIFSASSHDGNETREKIHKSIVITDNIFKDISVPPISLTSVSGVTLKNNTYSSLPPVTSNCDNVTIE